MNATQQPLIGIPSRHDRSGNYRLSPVNAQAEPYLKATVQAGGIPFMIPLNLPRPALRRLYDLADGLMLTGGGDVEPTLYGAQTHRTQGDVQPDRDAEEILLAQWAAADEKPLLAICRGIQVISVAFGGTLWQDIPSQLPDAELHHYIYNKTGSNPSDFLAHAVNLADDSQLAQILQSNTVWTNSLHHQAVKTVENGLRVMGRSTDGIIETVEKPGHPFFMGVQWHPEMLVEHLESARAIFRAFVAACNRG